MPPNRSPDLHASLSFVHHADLRLARLDITLRPGARNDHERRRVLGVDAGSDRAGGIDYYAHRSLGPAQRVLRFNPPGPTELGDNGPGSMKILWRLDESTDLLVSLDTRCAEKLLTLLPAVDVLLETLQVCPPPPPVDPAQDLQTRHGPAPGKPVRALDPELISRYQVFAEHFVRGMRRLPPDLEDYRPLLEGTRQATESELAELREAANWPDGPFKDTPLLLLLHTFDAGSGLDRVDPMTYHTVGGSFAVFAGKGGTRLLPDWYQNLLLNPEGSIEIGTRTIEVKARVLDAERREAIWQEQKTRYPGLADYETNTRPIIPVVMLDRR